MVVCSHNLGVVLHKKATYRPMIALVLVVLQVLAYFWITRDGTSRTYPGA